MQKSHGSRQKNWNYYTEERRKEVAQMLAQGHTMVAQLEALEANYATPILEKLKKDGF